MDGATPAPLETRRALIEVAEAAGQAAVGLAHLTTAVSMLRKALVSCLPAVEHAAGVEEAEAAARLIEAAGSNTREAFDRLVQTLAAMTPDAGP